jgi:hypothetical protein
MHRADIVSSHLVRSAKGLTVSGSLVLVVDEAGEFCDLEVTLAETNRMAHPIAPQEAVRIESIIDTYIDDSAEVGWLLDESLGNLAISLSPDLPKRWLEIQKDYLYLDVDPQGQLRTIFFQNVQVDPGGELQSLWLEELEGSIGANE